MFGKLIGRLKRKRNVINGASFSPELVEDVLFGTTAAAVVHVRFGNVKKPSCFLKHPMDENGNVFTVYYADGDEKKPRAADDTEARVLFHGIRDRRLLVFEKGQLDTFKDIFWEIDFDWPTEEDIGDELDCDVVVLSHEEAEAMLYLEGKYRKEPM